MDLYIADEMEKTRTRTGLEDDCRCLFWEYCGDNIHRCLRCARLKSSVPEGAIMVRHDCEVCRRTARAMTLSDLRQMTPEQREEVISLALAPEEITSDPDTHHAAKYELRALPPVTA
jgi:hypothetical protein